MRNKALAAIKEYSMILPGDTVFVGLSGGADSIALTHFLYSIKDDIGFKLQAIHINHNLRGQEAVRDENFAAEFCARLNIPLTAEHHNVAEIAEKRGQSCEQAGRAVRYEAFNRISSKVPNGKIATAHTLSDVMETMLFNMTRGSGINGLCGIPAVRDNIIRPLIKCTRADIERYCEKNGLDYVTDSTNLSNDFSRNKIRHIVIPALCDINPSLDKTMQRLSQHAAQDEECLCGLAKSALDDAKCEGGYSVQKLALLPPALLNRALIIASGTNPEARHIELLTECLLKGSGSVQINSRLVGQVSGNALSFAPLQMQEEAAFWSVPVIDGTAELGDGRKLFLNEISSFEAVKAQKINKLLFFNAFCCDTINGKLTARLRKGGDTFSPVGRNCTKTLKKLFNEQGVPTCERSRRVLLEADGEIIWIEGLGISQKVLPDLRSARVFEIILTNNKTEDELL